MGRASYLRRTRHWVANRGWKSFFAEIWGRGVGLLKRSPGLLVRRLVPSAFNLPAQQGSATPASVQKQPVPQVHPFDEQYSVDTSGVIWGEHLNTRSPGDYWVTGYYGIAPSVFSQLLDRLQLDWQQYTFIDVGCGKGRALMLALGYPFRRCIGVELSPQLVEIARSNLARFAPPWPRLSPGEVILADATTFALPPEPTVLYLYHPFSRPIMTRFLDHLRASLQQHPRPVYLVYTNPELDSLLMSSGFLRKLWEDSFALDQQDMIADHFGSVSDRGVAYVST